MIIGGKLTDDLTEEYEYYQGEPTLISSKLGDIVIGHYGLIEAAMMDYKSNLNGIGINTESRGNLRSEEIAALTHIIEKTVTRPYSPEEIAKGINPRQGEMDSIMQETAANRTPQQQEQDPNVGGDKR